MDDATRAVLKRCGYDLDIDGFAFETSTYAVFSEFAAAVRAAALEEAAKVCEQEAENYAHSVKADIANTCAAAIRALKEKP